MDIDEAKELIKSKSVEEQIQLVATLCLDVTVIARNSYRPGTEDIDDPQFLRKCNEIQHQFTSLLVRLVCGEGEFVAEIVSNLVHSQKNQELDSMLRTAFQRATSLHFK